jgi:hypothetical protein
VGQEFSRCTGFCLGLNKEVDLTEWKVRKLAGIKFGVWQLHILLIDGIRGSAYGPFEVGSVVTVSFVWFDGFFSLWVRYIVWVLSFVLLWCLPAFGGVRECFHHRISSALFSTSVKSVRGSFQCASFLWGVVVSVGGRGVARGRLCDKEWESR